MLGVAYSPFEGGAVRYTRGVRNAVRLGLVLALLVPVVVWFEDFAQHVSAYLSGSAISLVIQQQWHYVVGSIALFVAFLVPLTWRRKAKDARCASHERFECGISLESEVGDEG